jgi:outer membrane receptor protein involved in Fe transport
MKLKTAVHLVLATAALSAAIPAAANEADSEVVVLEEILVTAQKRVENVQAVPIAVTALTADAMQAQQINYGADLQRAVPNMNFSRLLAGETNFQIRGIGYQLVATAGDAGVGLHSNNIPLSVSRIADVDFYDLERVEVLRGPQGTLYGRNATGGVINVITAKPSLDGFSGSGTLEAGNYDTKKFVGHINLPMGDKFAARLAGTWLNRDGYTENLATGETIDGRDLWSARVSLLFAPTDSFKATFRMERFDENDDRNGGARELCIKDAGPTSVGGVATDGGGNAARATQNLLSRGCLPGSVYSPEANGTVNYTATLAGQLGTLAGLTNGDIYSGVMQSNNLREVSIAPMANHKIPQYSVLNDLYEMNLEWDFADGLKATSLTGYGKDELTTITSASYSSSAVFNNVAGLAPGGVYNDPQIGPSSHPQVVDIQHNIAKQWSSELRLQSSFTGPVNFNAGGIYFNLEKVNDRFIAPNTQNYYVQLANILNGTATPLSTCATSDCYFDTSAFPDGTGHNYFVSHVPYKLQASALFGELYWDVADTVRLTTGLRYTDDRKNIDLYPSNMLQPGQGATPNGLIQQEARWKETTGRVNLDWHPTDNALLYASYSKGYKGGGINNPNANDTSPAYDPEFVNAYEIGSKNTLVDGRLMLNATAFMYEYDGYQISQLRGLVSATENIDAEVKGAELEMLWKPVERLRMNAALGYLNTKIKAGTSIDTFDRIQGQTGVSLVKATNDTCLASTTQLANLISMINAGTLPTRTILGVCSGAVSALVTPLPSNTVDLKGKELPQSPEFTGSAGAEYAFELTSSWDMTVRGDYYYQTEAFTRVYNTISDELHAWSNVNASITFASKDAGLAVQLYGKNLADKDVITGYTSNSDQLGLTRGITLLDPRLYGVNVTYSFGK